MSPSYTSKDALRPVLASALNAIKSAQRAGAPLTHDGLRERLGYRSRGAVGNVTRELRELGLVTLDKSVQPNFAQDRVANGGEGSLTTLDKMQKGGPARGNRDGRRNRDLRRVAISFDDDLFDEIRSLARTRKMSFAGQVRALARKGLERSDGVRR